MNIATTLQRVKRSSLYKRLQPSVVHHRTRCPANSQPKPACVRQLRFYCIYSALRGNVGPCKVQCRLQGAYIHTSHQNMTPLRNNTEMRVPSWALENAVASGIISVQTPVVQASGFKLQGEGAVEYTNVQSLRECLTFCKANCVGVWWRGTVCTTYTSLESVHHVDTNNSWAAIISQGIELVAWCLWFVDDDAYGGVCVHCNPSSSAQLATTISREGFWQSHTPSMLGPSLHHSGRPWYVVARYASTTSSVWRLHMTMKRTGACCTRR